MSAQCADPVCPRSFARSGVVATNRRRKAVRRLSRRTQDLTAYSAPAMATAICTSACFNLELGKRV
jgi:hypothetical protein